MIGAKGSSLLHQPESSWRHAMQRETIVSNVNEYDVITMTILPKQRGMTTATSKRRFAFLL